MQPCPAEPDWKELEQSTALGLDISPQLTQVLETSQGLCQARAHLLLSHLMLLSGEQAQAFYHLQQSMRLGLVEPCQLAFSALCRVAGQLDRAQSWLDISSTPSFERELEQGLVLRELGRYQRAEQCFLKALHLALELGGAKDLPALRTYHRLGVIYCILGRYSESRSFLRTCLEGLTVLSTKPGLLETEVWHDYALLCLATKRTVEAEGFACRALYTRKQRLGSETSGLAKSYVLIGNVFLEHDAVRSERSLLKSLSLLRHHQGAETDQASAHLSLAALYLQQGELEAALRHAQRGSGLLRSLPRPHADRASALLLLSSVMKANGRSEWQACEAAAKSEYTRSLPAEHNYVNTNSSREQ